MIYRNLDITWLGHSGVKIKTGNGIIVYIDPFKIYEGEEDADFIFITHSHYDHCSIEDIQKIAKEGTVIVCTPDCQSKFRHIDNRIDIVMAEPGGKLEFADKNINSWAVRAYNINKDFHSREEDWVGYIIKFGDTLIYHAGDTDLIPEMKQIKDIDIGFLPIGGTYTMNAGEAVKAASMIRPKLAIPIHYGSIVGIGSKADAELFLKYCSGEGVEVKIL